MKEDLSVKAKNFLNSIESPGLKKTCSVFFRWGNLWYRRFLDFLAIFKDVKLYRKDGIVNYEEQWAARLGKKENNSSYGNFELYRDPQGADKNNMRGDDIFMLSILPEGSSVLELGCGNGRLGYILKNKKNINYCGVDVSETAVAQAKKIGIEAYVCDLNNFNDPILKTLEKRHFDYVISLWTLQLLSRTEVLLPKLFEFSDVQLHGVWNAGHWSSRLRMLFGRFPIYSYSTSPDGKHIYPYAYGQYQRHWTFRDFKAYSKELGFAAEPAGMGKKFVTKTADLKKSLFMPSLFVGRVVWKITKPEK